MQKRFPVLHLTFCSGRCISSGNNFAIAINGLGSGSNIVNSRKLATPKGSLPSAKINYTKRLALTAKEGWIISLDSTLGFWLSEVKLGWMPLRYSYEREQRHRKASNNSSLIIHVHWKTALTCWASCDILWLKCLSAGRQMLKIPFLAAIIHPSINQSRLMHVPICVNSVTVVDSSMHSKLSG